MLSVHYDPTSTSGKRQRALTKVMQEVLFVSNESAKRHQVWETENLALWNFMKTPLLLFLIELQELGWHRALSSFLCWSRSLPKINPWPLLFRLYTLSNLRLLQPTDEGIREKLRGCSMDTAIFTNKTFVTNVPSFSFHLVII